MANRVLSDAEIRRRKKLQGQISRTTSTLGLTGVALGVGSLATKKPQNLARLRKVPGLKKVTEQKLKDAALYTSLTSGGIGGVGGYNFAAYTGAESRKRKPVSKSVDDFGYFGEIGKAMGPVKPSMPSTGMNMKAKMPGSGATLPSGKAATYGTSALKSMRAKPATGSGFSQIGNAQKLGGLRPMPGPKKPQPKQPPSWTAYAGNKVKKNVEVSAFGVSHD